jgi:hypothetical protein
VNGNSLVFRSKAAQALSTTPAKDATLACYTYRQRGALLDVIRVEFPSSRRAAA